MHCAAVGVLSCLYKPAEHLSALSRRGVGSSHGIVNCRPAQCCVWPVAAPAEGIVRAGSCGAAWAVPWGCFMVGSRLPCVSSGMSCVCSCQLYAAIQMSCVRITPAVCRMAPNRTACDMLRFYSAVDRDRRSCVLESLVRLSRMVGLIWACAFPYGDLDGGRKGQGNSENGVGGAAWVRFCVNALALLCFPRGVRWGKRWKPHCGRAPDCAKETRLPGLSSCDSRCGCVLRGEGHSGATKTRPAPISGGRTAAGRTGRAVYD